MKNGGWSGGAGVVRYLILKSLKSRIRLGARPFGQLQPIITIWSKLNATALVLVLCNYQRRRCCRSLAADGAAPLPPPHYCPPPPLRHCAREWRAAGMRFIQPEVSSCVVGRRTSGGTRKYAASLAATSRRCIASPPRLQSWCNPQVTCPKDSSTGCLLPL